MGDSFQVTLSDGKKIDIRKAYDVVGELYKKMTVCINRKMVMDGLEYALEALSIATTVIIERDKFKDHKFYKKLLLFDAELYSTILASKGILFTMIGMYEQAYDFISGAYHTQLANKFPDEHLLVILNLFHAVYERITKSGQNITLKPPVKMIENQDEWDSNRELRAKYGVFFEMQVYLECGKIKLDHKEIDQMFNEVLEYFSTKNFKEGIADVNRIKGYLYYLQKKKEQAISEIKIAKNIYVQQDLPAKIKLCNDFIQDINQNSVRTYSNYNNLTRIEESIAKGMMGSSISFHL